MELPIKEYIRKNYVSKKKLIELKNKLTEEINRLLEEETDEESNR